MSRVSRKLKRESRRERRRERRENNKERRSKIGKALRTIWEIGKRIVPIRPLGGTIENVGDSVGDVVEQARKRNQRKSD